MSIREVKLPIGILILYKQLLKSVKGVKRRGNGVSGRLNSCVHSKTKLHVVKLELCFEGDILKKSGLISFVFSVSSLSF